MGTIEKRGENSWRIGVRLGAEQGRKWVRDTLTFPASMPEAEQRHAAEVALAQLVIDLDQGRTVPDRALTFQELSGIWLKNYVEAECEPPTQKTYRNFLEKRLLPTFGGMKLQNITPLMLSTFLAELRKAPKASQRKPDDQLKRKRTPSDRAKMAKKENETLSDTTVRHYYDTLNSIFKHGVMWEMMRRNPLEAVPRPKVRKKKVKYLDDEKAVQLLRCLKNEEDMSFRSAVLLALLCGLRLGEAGALNLSDVDWEEGTIDIQRARAYTPETGNYDGDTKSEAGERLVSLPPGMLALLEETREYQKDIAATIGDVWEGDGRIVCGWNGAALHHDTPSKQWRKFADNNGFKGVRFHDLRHTHATLLFADNIDAVAVASRLGHSDASVTLKIYAHALRRRDVESAATMQRLMDKADEPE
ncbi:site-specific integrase [Eubacteriales bacterium OttesenSCG-928-A19]|nr:site-specific integrase [Eubacteriales bacterium OttesenSCG-928-A19]